MSFDIVADNSAPNYDSVKTVLNNLANSDKTTPLLVDSYVSPVAWNKGKEIPSLNIDWSSLKGMTDSLESDVVYKQAGNKINRITNQNPVLYEMYFILSIRVEKGNYLCFHKYTKKALLNFWKITLFSWVINSEIIINKNTLSKQSIKSNKQSEFHPFEPEFSAIIICIQRVALYTAYEKQAPDNGACFKSTFSEILC